MIRLALFLACGSVLAVSCFAQSGTDLRPGNWQLTVEVSAVGERTAPVRQTLVQCLTAADAKNPGRVLAGNAGAGDCRFSDEHRSPGHLDFAVSCGGEVATTGRGSMDFSSDALAGRLDLDLGRAGGPRLDLSTRIRGRRIGAC